MHLLSKHLHPSFVTWTQFQMKDGKPESNKRFSIILVLCCLVEQHFGWDGRTLEHCYWSHLEYVYQGIDFSFQFPGCGA